MHLSKQEFSKLSRAEQNKLMNVKKKKSQKRKNPPPRPPPQKQASVAAAYATEGKTRMAKVDRKALSFRIRNKEFVSTVSSVLPLPYSISNVLELNPGIASTFPWLSTQAIGWEKYKFHKLRFHFLTRVSTSVQGSVIIAPDYDAADSAPQDEATITAYQNTVECVPWKDMVVELKTSSLAEGKDRRFIRSIPLANNLDIKTYDVGKLFIATAGTNAAQTLGKLWVEYDVEFFIPQLPSVQNVLSPVSSVIESGGALSTGNPLGSAPSQDAGSAGISVDGNSKISFLKTGTFLLEMISQATTSVDSINFNIADGCTVAPLGGIGAGSTVACRTTQVNVNSLPASVTPVLTATGTLGPQRAIVSGFRPIF